jgi:hypothetical protein
MGYLGNVVAKVASLPPSLLQRWAPDIGFRNVFPTAEWAVCAPRLT